MAGTTEKILTLTYLDGSVETRTVWDWNEPEEADINPAWLEEYGRQNCEVFGLDPDVDSYLVVNLAALRHFSLKPVEPQDAVPDPMPPISAQPYELRDFINH
jgi:hypothetical protein